jgi:hypothetical protein
MLTLSALIVDFSSQHYMATSEIVSSFLFNIILYIENTSRLLGSPAPFVHTPGPFYQITWSCLNDP